MVLVAVRWLILYFFLVLSRFVWFSVFVCFSDLLSSLLWYLCVLKVSEIFFIYSDILGCSDLYVLFLLTHTLNVANNGRSYAQLLLFFSSSILLHIQHKYYLLFRLSTRAIRIDFFYIREKRTVFDNPSTVCTPCFIFRSYYDYVSNGNKQCTTNALTYTFTTFNIGRVFLPDTYIRCARLRLCVRCMYEFIVSTEYYRCDDVMLSLSSQAISRHIHTQTPYNW